MNLSQSQKNLKIINFINCSLIFNDRVIFTDVNLEIFQGEKLAIIGKNGSGKTSLIEAIIDPHQNFQGLIERSENLIFSFIFQDLEFSGPIINLLEDITYLMGIENKTDQGLKSFEISHLKTRAFDYLSPGEKQKVKLLISFLQKPDVIVIDEMTTSLDYITRLKAINLVKDILKKYPDITLIMISHDENEIAELCDQYVILADQKISEKKPLNAQDKINHVISILDSI